MLHQEALALRPTPHADRAKSLNNLGIALYEHFKQNDNLLDVEKAVDYHREALSLRPSPNPS